MLEIAPALFGGLLFKTLTNRLLYYLSEAGWQQVFIYHVLTQLATQHIIDRPVMFTGGLIVNDTR